MTEEKITFCRICEVYCGMAFLNGFPVAVEPARVA